MIGRQIQVGIGKESTRGTVATPAYWIPKFDASVEDKVEKEVSSQSFGTIYESDGSIVAKKYAEGEISGKVRDKSFGLLALATMGKITSGAGGETGVYSHLLEVEQSNQHQSVTIEMKNDAEQVAFANAVIKSLKLTADVGKSVEFSAGFMAKAGVTSANTPAYTVENEFNAKHATIKFATTVAGLAGAQAIPVKGIELSIDKAVDEEMKLGSVEPVDFYNKEFGVEGNIEATYADTETFKDLYKAGTVSAVEIKIENADVIIGTTLHPSITIVMPKVSLESWARGGSNKDIVKQTIKFKAHHDLTDGSMIEMTLINGVATY